MVGRLGKRVSDKGFLTISFEAYVKLLDWTGRQLKRGKTGRIPADAQPILERMEISGEVWVEVVRRFGKIFARAAGSPQSLNAEATKRGQLRLIAHGSPLAVT
jgi:hypothetical protein